MTLLPLLLTSTLLPLFLILFLFIIILSKPTTTTNLPPGTYGYPIIGETLTFLTSNRQGKPHKFILNRLSKHNTKIFKTSILGEKMVVFSGSTGLRFLFCNENKLVNQWWPKSVQILLCGSLTSLVGNEAKRVRKLLFGFFNVEVLCRFVKVVDEATKEHLANQWRGKDELKVYPIVKLHTFELACRLFMTLENPQQISRLNNYFHTFLKGVVSIPIYFPGTNFYNSSKAGKLIRKELREILKKRKKDIEEKITVVSKDLISHLLVTADEDGKFLTEEEIVSNVMMLLFAGHDTSTCVITLIVKYLAELPEVYAKVLEEQQGICSSKGSDEYLNWKDLQKMKYTWNVISEIMRLTPPITGSFRQAIVDFNYEGYNIPKGFKIMWSAAAHHRDTSNFPNEDKFDPSRFEGSGPAPYTYAPFGGGPRMCLGMEFARLKTLVFLHHLVKMFKWEMCVPGEEVIFDPMPIPAEELPIRLLPHSG